MRPWRLIKGWMVSSNCLYWKKILIEKINWSQPVVKVFGQTHAVPRLAAFLAKERISYRYSGYHCTAELWPDWFLPLLDAVNTQCDVQFNGCLLNFYRNGYDRMGWHADNEAELDSSSKIASLSLGATRDFHFKHRSDKTKSNLLLSDGDLLIMESLCQKDWLHSLPARNRVYEPRINLTFRRYI